VFPAYGGGIGLGNVSFYALPSAYTTIGSVDEYREMLASTKGIGSAPALNLFVIGDFSNQAYGGAIGVAGGIPGATAEHGTALSGVAYQPSGDAAYDATVLLHEVGHLGGLFHTTEISIEETDSLDDTPACDPALISSSPNQCPDKSNVMFPIAYGATKYSPHQLTVLRGSSIYRGVLAEGQPPAPPLPFAPPPVPPFAKLGASAAARVVRSHRPVRLQADDALGRVLAGVWCGTGSTDYLGLALRVAGSPERLREIALSPSAADLVRARALTAYVRGATARTTEIADALALAERFARDEAEVSEVRAAALHALAAHASPRATSVARALRASADPVVHAIALRLAAP
jgi:hypothetical protein